MCETKDLVIKFRKKPEEYLRKIGRSVVSQILVDVFWATMDEEAADDAERHDSDLAGITYKQLCSSTRRRAQRLRGILARRPVVNPVQPYGSRAC